MATASKIGPRFWCLLSSAAVLHSVPGVFAPNVFTLALVAAGAAEEERAELADWGDGTLGDTVDSVEEAPVAEDVDAIDKAFAQRAAFTFSIAV